MEIRTATQSGFAFLFLALTTFMTFRLSSCNGAFASFKNINIKLCQEQCTEHCRCLSIEYSIVTLTCRLFEVEAKKAAEGFIDRREREPGASSLMSKGSRSSKAITQDRSCFVTKPGKETCVKAAQNPTQETEKVGNKLLQAVKFGHLRYVNYILESGLADINVKNLDGMTPILIAAAHGKRQVFELLLNKGADITAIDEKSFTILYCAINGGDLGILKLILRANKVDINQKCGPS